MFIKYKQGGSSWRGQKETFWGIGSCLSTLIMISKAWICVLFDLWENYDFVIKCKDRSIERIASFGWQCATGLDGERACDELIDRLVERQAITTVVADLKKAFSMLSASHKRILRLKLRDKRLFWQIATKLGCTVRNAIYLYKGAIDKIIDSLVKKGYTDSVLAEMFEGDAMIESMLEYAEDRA